MTRDELDELPAVVSVTEAAEVLGIGRGLAYELIKAGAWPTPVLRVGRLIRVPTAPLIALLTEDRGGDSIHSSPVSNGHGSQREVSWGRRW